MSTGHELAGRQPDSRYVTVAIAGSAIVHAALFALAIVMTLLEPPKLDLAQKPVSAKLVRLGQKRPDNLLPRKDISSPPPPQPKASPNSPVSIKAKDPAAPSKATTSSKPSAEQARRDLFKAFEKTGAKHDEPPIGDPDGDPEGDSDTAEEGERYFGLILAKARRNYGVTKTIPPQELMRLKATVVIFIGSTGDLVKDPEVQVSSGNEQFDQDVILSLKKAAPFGPPPPHLAEALKTVGIAFEATPF
ncbi:MAG: TonB C-terminal domain-containing protein [Deltaproteobacteria bacterium]|nr:TonB C-terminal domain-containing protein [Deltaproteobacteria bacterium]